VILVSHDMHLLELVADRLWLVKDGRVTPYEDDLEAYRALLLGADRKSYEGHTEVRRKSDAPKRASKADLATLRGEVRRAEERVAKLEEMAGKLSTRLADPALYEDDRKGELDVWQRKFAEVEEALERAEALWLEASEKFEAAGS